MRVLTINVVARHGGIALEYKGSRRFQTVYSGDEVKWQNKTGSDVYIRMTGPGNPFYSEDFDQGAPVKLCADGRSRVDKALVMVFECTPFYFAVSDCTATTPHPQSSNNNPPCGTVIVDPSDND